MDTSLKLYTFAEWEDRYIVFAPNLKEALETFKQHICKQNGDNEIIPDVTFTEFRCKEDGVYRGTLVFTTHYSKLPQDSVFTSIYGEGYVEPDREHEYSVCEREIETGKVY